MEFIEAFIVNGIFILFPLLVYIVYVAYCESQNKKKQQLMLVVALFCSIILVMRHGIRYRDGYYIIFLNIPLLISFMKRKSITAILISFILVLYLHQALDFGYIPLILEYSVYYIVYLLTKKKKWTFDRFLNTFTLLKASMMSFEVFFYYSDKDPFLVNVNLILASVIIFYIEAVIVFSLFKKAENTVQMNTVMKELEKEKLLRNSLFKITHEIKNPIAVCKGYLDMLDPNNIEKANQYIPIVRSEIARTLTLMDDFLDYTRIKINKDILDIYYLLEETTKSLNSLLKSEKISTKFEIPDEELFLYGDYDRLKQVFINLFKNAKEASATEITLITKKLKDQIKITVKDNGVGMDEETLKRVGEMFFTTKEKGTGLGTGLSKEIIELHGGNIKYDSKVGVGTKVMVYLPIEKELNTF